MGNLKTPSSVQKLQTALHAKAKGEPGYRFYLLYDKVHREDVLAHAYACCRANKGAAGVDGETFDDIEAYGVERWLGELAEALRKKTYQAQAVRRVYIPKPNGKQRPLGIPTIRDRVVQSALMMVLDAIFEADLLPEQHAYRKDHSALSAVQQVHGWLTQGHTQVIDADLSGYFDSIPHEELMKSVARRVVDRQVLHLIKMWLDAPVEEADKRGRTQRTTGNRDSNRGIPQGAPISPLLSNLYMRRLVLGWKRLGHERRYAAHIVNYADDLVICCGRQADEALVALRQLVARLKLAVNEDKTHICRLPQGRFDFLGYSFERCYSEKTGRPFLGTRPSKKSITRLMKSISDEAHIHRALLDTAYIVERLNRKLTGWANYFCLGPVSKSYQAIDRHTALRLRWWLCNKHKVPKATKRFSFDYQYEKLGLVSLRAKSRNRPWATA